MSPYREDAAELVPSSVSANNPDQVLEWHMPTLSLNDPGYTVLACLDFDADGDPTTVVHLSLGGRDPQALSGRPSDLRRMLRAALVACDKADEMLAAVTDAQRAQVRAETQEEAPELRRWPPNSPEPTEIGLVVQSEENGVQFQNIPSRRTWRAIWDTTTNSKADGEEYTWRRLNSSRVDGMTLVEVPPGEMFQKGSSK